MAAAATTSTCVSASETALQGGVAVPQGIWVLSMESRLMGRRLGCCRSNRAASKFAGSECDTLTCVCQPAHDKSSDKADGH